MCQNILNVSFKTCKKRRIIKEIMTESVLGNCKRKRIKFSHPGHPLPISAIPCLSHGSQSGFNGFYPTPLTGRIAVYWTTGAETMAKQSCGHFKIRYCSLEPNCGQIIQKPYRFVSVLMILSKNDCEVNWGPAHPGGCPLVTHGLRNGSEGCDLVEVLVYWGATTL